MPYEVIRDMQSGRLDPDFSELLLSSAVSAVGSFLEICASKNQIMRNRKIQETAFQALWKKSTVIKPKRGFDGHTSKSDPTNKIRGGLRRFAKTIVPRIRENHDLEGSSLLTNLSTLGGQKSWNGLSHEQLST